jgi:hypothetical protein
MKTTKIATFMPISHTIILTKYQDAEKCNWMLNIEFHLPLCSVRDDFELFLEKEMMVTSILFSRGKCPLISCSLNFLRPSFLMI